MYFRQWDDAYCTGSYRHEPRIVSPYEVGQDAYWQWREDDWAVAAEDALYLYPCLRGREYVTKVNGMFVFSVDGFPMMGPTQVPGFWSCVGIWVTHAGGAGKAIAEWMARGTTEWDMREADVNRFHEHQQTKRYIQIRTAQNYREVYDIIHPLDQMREPRNVRLAPYHARLQAQQGEFFSVSGWEAAQWYGENAWLLEKYENQIPERSGWEARFWSRIQGAEHLAVRENGGLFNISTFTKIEVAGAGALDYLERLAANQIEQPAGKVIYTSLLNTQGGIKADLTVTRLAGDRFWLLTGAGTGPADLFWLNSHAPADGSVTIRDLTSAYTGVGLWGPQARAVLQSVADEDVSNDVWPYFTARPVTIDTIPATALRLSYAGELGWEIYCRAEFGLRLWDVLWETGRPFGLIAFGGGAFNSLRLEKGYRAYGAELHSDYNPYEAGLGWAVRLHKGDFIGREALLKAKEKGLSRKLCCLTFDEPDGMALGKEPIFSLAGETLGYVTSADYGYSVGKFIVYAYLPIAAAAKGTQVQIKYFDRQYRATVADDPLFDAEMVRLKS
jgi:glycine cleavage system T protein